MKKLEHKNYDAPLKGFHHTMTHLKSTVFWADISFLSSLFMDGHTQWSQEIYGVALEF